MRADAYVLAGLVRGLSMGLDAFTIRKQLVRHGNRDVHNLLSNRATMQALTDKARLHITRSQAGVSDRVRAARALVGVVLGPGRLGVTDRAVLAHLALASMTSGWATIQTSRDTVAYELGLPVPTVRDSLRRLVERGYVRVHAQRQGHAHVYKLGLLRSAGDRATALLLDEVVTALVDGDDSNRVAKILRSVDSPRWGYSAVQGHASWLYLATDAAGQEWPLGPRSKRRATESVGAPVASVINDAINRKAAAREELANRQQGRMEGVEQARLNRTEALATVDWLVDRTGNPKLLIEPGERMQWVRAARAQLGSGGGWDRGQVRATLARRLAMCGWPEKAARSAAQAVTKEQ
ncbi:TrmB family transcriptional regulator [Ornithinimicrobium ciconiae]|uniref:TrmB family transcriptional regulator n=1 Tax=Ornithinimicrobium ciconiae TaxID=2594265 RepID=A0A516GEJ0_9MICO|nr:TrmB family transcriptional regulator [Ornithinimicrobium ciconiae]QDO89925.1 TrmB family transcriptional regulator [Ornithinimicrobium ciconiae]